MAASSKIESSAILRLATQADVKALTALKLLTFRETFIDGFQLPYPPADLAQFEAEAYSESGISAEIADVAHKTWVFHTADGALAAYCHVGPCKLPHVDVGPKTGELCQVYVRNSAQGQGLGRKLMTVALEWLAQAYPGPLFLGVWSGNTKAQALYSSAGFRKVGEYGFMVGTHRDEEWIFRKD